MNARPKEQRSEKNSGDKKSKRKRKSWSPSN